MLARLSVTALLLATMPLAGCDGPKAAEKAAPSSPPSAKAAKNTGTIPDSSDAPRPKAKKAQPDDNPFSDDAIRAEWHRRADEARERRKAWLDGKAAAAEKDDEVAALKKKYNWHLDRADKKGMDAVKAKLAAIEYERQNAKADAVGVQSWEPRAQTIRDVTDAEKVYANVFEVFQVINPRAALVRQVGQIYFLEMNATGLADGERFRLDGIFVPDGTRQYGTVLGGTNTVRAFRYVRD